MRLVGWIRSRTQEPDWGEIQGGILQGYGHPRVAYLFLRVTDPDDARLWIGRLAPTITDASDYGKDRPVTRNVAFTARGLRALGVSDGVMNTFSDEFLKGMRERAADVLGDWGESHPAKWEKGPQCAGADILVIVQGQDEAQVAAEVEELERHPLGVERFHLERGLTLEGSREHFGFSDGFAQPSLRKVRYRGPQPRGNGVPLPAWGWRRMAIGEFVLGYYDEDLVRPEAPRGPLGRDATYMVWRKLEQDVDGFKQAMLDAAGDDELRARWLKARLVGRWDDGTPLAVSPDEPDPAVAKDPERRNDFRYADDPLGLRCPVGAHVRRANPRDALGWGHKRSFRHRIIRNGFAYDYVENDRPEPRWRRGLVFVCFNANLSRQFEVVQGAWSADGRVFGLGRDRDPLIGQPLEDRGKFVIGGHPPSFLSPLKQYVRTCSGEYLFMPGIAALYALANGRE